MNKKFWLSIVLGPAMALLLAAGVQGAVSHELKWRHDLAEGQARINERLARIETALNIQPSKEKETHVAVNH